MRFTDRVALITAVASGIGRATADIMGREGAVIIGVDNNEARLETAMAEIRTATAARTAMSATRSTKSR